MTDPLPISVIVVTYNSGHDVADGLARLSDQLGVGDELIVVDNASVDDSVAVVRAAAPAARVLALGENLGFAGGVNRGATEAAGELLLLLNPDAVPAPGCLDALRRAATDHPDWGCWQAMVALADGEHVNTAGGRMHLLGFGWSGDWGDPIDRSLTAHEVGFASGAALCVRTPLWRSLGGFDPRFFMYCEDLDLSVRLRSAGWGVGVAPDAVVEHDYEFDKGANKWFYLERNRWAVVLANYPARLLVLAFPLLLAFELALIPVALAGGWWPSKRRAVVAAVRDLPHTLRRRRAVQAARVISDRAFAQSLTVDLDGEFFGPIARVAPIGAALRVYRALVLRALSDRPRGVRVGG
ncbi:MAG: glycosyltransferase family 2 protein [Patulibacter minatonensis]